LEELHSVHCSIISHNLLLPDHAEQSFPQHNAKYSMQVLVLQVCMHEILMRVHRCVSVYDMNMCTLIHTAACRPITRQWLWNKHVPTATNPHTTTDELLVMVFYEWSVLRCYKENNCSKSSESWIISQQVMKWVQKLKHLHC
jgi:hypothetical protein